MPRLGASARLAQESGLLSALPANGSRLDGSTYLATDQFGGTTYRMVSGVWVQQAAGVSQASGGMAAGPVQLSSLFDVKAVGTTVTDVTGMTLNVPASSSRGVMLRALFQAVMNGGTSTANSLLTIQLFITDNSNNQLAEGAMTITSLGSAKSITGQIPVELWLPAPVTATTYKIRAACAAAVPANWTNANLLPGHGTAGSVSNFYGDYK